MFAECKDSLTNKPEKWGAPTAAISGGVRAAGRSQMQRQSDNKVIERIIDIQALSICSKPRGQRFGVVDKEREIATENTKMQRANWSDLRRRRRCRSVAIEGAVW